MKRIINNILLVFFAILFLISGIKLYQYFAEAKASTDSFEAVARLVKEEPIVQTQPVETVTEQTIETSATEPTINEKYLAVYEQNNDFVGWLSIEGTDIDYPIMQTPDDPDYYLRRGFDGSYNRYGVPYMQENCVIGTSDNLIIYGHNMNNGTMFADLCEYEDESFYESHRFIQFDTLYEEGKYEILAVFKTVASSDAGFKYHYFVNADDKDDFDTYIATCKELSLYDTGVAAEYGDRLLTLSTCEYSKSDGRMVLVAKQIGAFAQEMK